MIRIGMVDYWLDNWHTNHYPDYLRLAARQYGFDLELTDAWAAQDAPNGGLTTEAWCEKKGMRRASSYEELISRVDAIMVMCADDCTHHEELAQKALSSGKRVYCDKTFAPNLAAAQRMITLAKNSGTPMFSCSAQRFCMELQNYIRLNGTKATFCSTTGPGDMVNYSIHQYEMIEAVMGAGAQRCIAFSVGDVRHVVYEYEDDRSATFLQGPGIPFRMLVSDGVRGEDVAITDYYMNFMYALCKFFTQGVVPVSGEDTLEIMAMQQAARTALQYLGEWKNVPQTTKNCGEGINQ